MTTPSTDVARVIATPGADVAPARPTWRDPKRWMWFGAVQIPLLPLAGIGGWRHSGSEIFLWATPIFLFLVVPVLEMTGRPDESNPPEELVPALNAQRLYRWVVYLYIPLQYAGLAVAGWEWTHASVSVWGRLGLALSTGIVAGVGINTAHELGHKRERLERRLAKLTLAQTGYGHFYVEHNRGHHTRVATREDPASSRLGESFWRFWPRAVGGSLRSSWRLEADRLRLRGHSVWSPRNENLNAWALTVVLFCGLAVWLGPGVLVLLAAQAVIGFSLLEVVNYLEHYGLARRRLESGRYERVEPWHSWNSTSLLSNICLFQLQRHSDHHANPTRRFQALRTFDEAPQLPWGYATMVTIALITPLWRRLMDHRVVEHYAGDLSLANVHAAYDR